MRQPYVVRKAGKRTGATRYTRMYYDATRTPRSAGTYNDEPEALTAAGQEQDKPASGVLGEMTLAQRRALTFEEF
ncbi:hypothetical protein [Actinomadura violacea]|uniref:Uncharacterized protein n=1 Tax=Actinomadura violacea TaxID=2819934 RepID=A0ABS3S108_9ACTN|nr:hypothetical protein [Actinomadura violacea]MBO2462393.1 hypothetical protein [Actinomadura violacea]